MLYYMRLGMIPFDINIYIYIHIHMNIIVIIDESQHSWV